MSTAKETGARERVLAKWPDAKCVGAGYLSAQVHIYSAASNPPHISGAFPKYHADHDEECGCMPEWRFLGEQMAWEDAASKLEDRNPASEPDPKRLEEIRRDVEEHKYKPGYTGLFRNHCQWLLDLLGRGK